MAAVEYLRLPTPAEALEASRASITTDVHSIVSSGTQALATLPNFIRRALECEAWKDRTTPAGQRVSNADIFDWITAKYPYGIGATVDVVRNLIRDDAAALAMWDVATKRADGAPEGNRNAAKSETTFDNVKGCSGEIARPKAPTGNSGQTALRRLRKDADAGDAKAADLLDRVTGGEMKPHAAAVEMGYRPKTITVREDAAALFAALMKSASPAEIALMAIKECDDGGLRAIFAGLADVLMARR